MSLRLSKKTKEAVVPLSLEDAAARAITRNRERKENKLAKVKVTGKIPENLLLGLWAKLVKQHFPLHPTVVKAKDITILKQHLRKIEAAGMDSVSYLGWVVEKWNSIMASKFAWMERRPEYPAIRVMVRFTDEFQAAYADRATIEAQSKMSVRERRAADKVRMGMDPKAAEEEATEEVRPRERRRGATVAQARNEQDRITHLKQSQNRNKPIQTPPSQTGTFGAWEEEP